MPKTTTIDHTSVLEMALVGFELQRNRIEAAIAEIQAELGQGGMLRKDTCHSAATATRTPRKKRFSAAARKRMALAQKKRWQLLKAKKAKADKPKRKPAAKRRKASVTASRKQRPVQVKAAEEDRSEAEGGEEDCETEGRERRQTAEARQRDTRTQRGDGNTCGNRHRVG